MPPPWALSVILTMGIRCVDNASSATGCRPPIFTTGPKWVPADRLPRDSDAETSSLGNEWEGNRYGVPGPQEPAHGLMGDYQRASLDARVAPEASTGIGHAPTRAQVVAEHLRGAIYSGELK